jgi:hypothetical protein
MPEFRITVSGKFGQRSWLTEYDTREKAWEQLRAEGFDAVSIEERPARETDENPEMHPEAIERHVTCRGERSQRRSAGSRGVGI